MNITLSTTDLLLTNDIDFYVDEETGELAKADNINAEVISQMVIKRVFSRKNDWALQPNCGADLYQFKGRPMTESLLTTIKSTILSELNREQMLQGSQMSVKTIPVSQTELLIVIFVRVELQLEPVVISSSLSLDSYIPVSHKLRRV